MAKITLKINGQDVQADEGSTILQAAKAAGIYVPTLCYHPFLPLEEACRICVVEEVRRGWSTLVAACVFPVRQGMVMETDSEMVNESRRTILELLLSDHPNACMTCQATGECELQDLAYRFQVTAGAYQGQRHKYPVDSDPHPLLHIDMNKCVLCRRCIRACHDIQGADVWTKVGRGFNQRISTAFELPLLDAGCESCGHCADFCPVDAIGVRGGRGEVRPWNVVSGSTICLQCACGCLAQYQMAGDKVMRVRADFRSPANRGALCKLGRFNFDFINGPQRVTETLVRGEGGELKPVALAEAIETAAKGLSEVRDAGESASIGIIAGGMLANEDYYAAQKLARGGLFTNNIDHVSGPWQLPVYEGLSTSLGLGAMTNSLEDLSQARSILVMGSNTLEKQAIAALKVRAAVRGGAKLLLAHPREVGLGKDAKMQLAIQPGSEDALVLAFIKTILDQKLYDEAFLEAYTQDFDKLVRSMEKVELAELAEKTGLSAAVLTEAAQMYAAQRPACLIYGLETGAAALNETFYRMCAALQLLLGSVGMAGGGVNVLGAAGNAQGAADFGAWPKYLPGYRPAGQSGTKKMIAKLWGAELPGAAGLSWPEMFEAMEKGTLTCLYLIGVDPFSVGIAPNKVEAALARLKLLIVQDCRKTRALDFAHVVLPAAPFIEKQGTAINCERRLQKLEPVVRSGVAGDFELINGLLKALNESLAFTGVDQAFAEAVQLHKDLDNLNLVAVTVEGVQLPVSPEGAGTERLGLPLEEGKAKFKFYAARM